MVSSFTGRFDAVSSLRGLRPFTVVDAPLYPSPSLPPSPCPPSDPIPTSHLHLRHIPLRQLRHSHHLRVYAFGEDDLEVFVFSPVLNREVLRLDFFFWCFGLEAIGTCLRVDLERVKGDSRRGDCGVAVSGCTGEPCPPQRLQSMKFLEYTPLNRINSFLCHLDVGGCMIQGVMEAYSCKLAGVDKKLSRSLEQEVVDSLAYSPLDLSTSPVGPLSNTASRRTLIHLILTLNHMYPDYDFSMLRPHHFTKEHGVLAAKQKIDVSLVEASKIWSIESFEETTLIDSIWSGIDQVISLEDCEVYSYSPDAEGDPFADTGSIKQSVDNSSSNDGSGDWALDFVDGMDLEG